MPHQVTVSSKTGPDRAVANLVLANATRVVFDLDRKVMQVFQDPPVAQNVKEYDLTPVNVIAFAIGQGNYTITAS